MYTRPLPLVQWQQHHSVATGQPYLHNPLTGEVRWLYSRFFDSATNRDYLVNAVTNERIWATPENDFLCPKPPGSAPLSSAPSTAPPKRAGRGADTEERPTGTGHTRAMHPASNRPQPITRPPTAARPAGSNPYGVAAAAGAGASPMSSPPPKAFPSSAAAGRSRAQAHSSDSPSPRRAAVDDLPDGLALGPDEVLMVAPGSLRRYIFNKRTRNSRWLTDADAAGGVAAQNGLYGDSRPSPTSSGARKSRTAKPSSEAIRDLQRALRGGAVRRLKVLEKLRSLADTMREIDGITATGSVHNLDALRAVISGKESTGMTRKDANLRLLELGEYCTQRMLKADGVDSSGNAIVRQRRKKTVTLILSIIDQVDSLRAKLAVSEAKHG
jgi:hypothetical protein